MVFNVKLFHKKIVNFENICMSVSNPLTANHVYEHVGRVYIPGSFPRLIAPIGEKIRGKCAQHVLQAKK